ncbi:PAAR domain-containing protein, partial [Cupriavidus sp. KB_39]|uniref:PAAR domain-containing protein n=1 Tax=Cupriavidus sp. KB_39 TaxID=3233036 RepID=UPI003F8E1A57
MRDIRYALLNGNATTTGGVLIALNTYTIHHGVNVGVEGDHATCPACKVGGPVYNDCDPRYSLHGKQILVSGARVFCKCKEHPRVLPSQSQ